MVRGIGGGFGDVGGEDGLLLGDLEGVDVGVVDDGGVGVDLDVVEYDVVGFRWLFG